MAQIHAGFILAEREQNMYHDSYFWLTVWNPYEGRPEQFEYAATAYGGIGPMHPQTVAQALRDTFPSVKQAEQAWQERNARRAAVEVLLLQFQWGYKFTGDTVRVARGRKVPKGLEGKILSVSERVTHTSRYGTWETKERFALIATATGAWEVNEKHLDVLQRGPILQTLRDLSE